AALPVPPGPPGARAVLPAAPGARARRALVDPVGPSLEPPARGQPAREPQALAQPLALRPGGADHAVDAPLGAVPGVRAARRRRARQRGRGRVRGRVLDLARVARHAPGGGRVMTSGTAPRPRVAASRPRPVPWTPPRPSPRASEPAFAAFGSLCFKAFLGCQFLSLTRVFFIEHMGDAVGALFSIAGLYSVAFLLPAVAAYGMRQGSVLGTLGSG